LDRQLHRWHRLPAWRPAPADAGATRNFSGQSHLSRWLIRKSLKEAGFLSWCAVRTLHETLNFEPSTFRNFDATIPGSNHDRMA